jgi:endoglucanase
MRHPALLGLGLLGIIGGCLRQAPPSPPPAVMTPPPDAYLGTQPEPIFEQAQALGRGVNLGNALDAPQEGEWGVTLGDEDFRMVAEAGFDHVRIPVRWSTHALDHEPYTIDPQFAARVRWAVDSSLAARLRVVLNVHHYEEMGRDPDRHEARLVALWKQIAELFQSYPDTLYFELFNEPHDALTAAKNNRLLGELLAVVRPSNPERSVIVGSVEYNSIRGLDVLALPVDPNLIVTIHYYEPFDFTHQGAAWANKQDQLGIDWPGKVGTERDIARAFDTAVKWAHRQGRPLYLGEFGAYEKAEFGARVRWTSAIVAEARARYIPYAYWELRSGFGLYDSGTKTWRRPLLDAVLPPKTAATPRALLTE